MMYFNLNIVKNSLCLVQVKLGFDHCSKLKRSSSIGQCDHVTLRITVYILGRSSVRFIIFWDQHLNYNNNNKTT